MLKYLYKGVLKWIYQTRYIIFIKRPSIGSQFIGLFLYSSTRPQISAQM